MKDLYAMTLEVRDKVAEIGATDMKQDITDHEYRIRELEKWVWRASGLAALAGAGISIIVQELMTRGA